ncbi:GNAT family N-acetyltransferase [Algoriphagus lacus]|uniref:GNAT family N-acetyltransferase n=1 Tax=Algoriphagus lacus TaxID=2056311 RepID=A0A418PNE5_9BACT|nr:GNAT family N-acetyltransferase [Algoriphagus lacus]RIW13130.1 GNAT family N-acetyltransferase [Algoriphagus lacus]
MLTIQVESRLSLEEYMFILHYSGLGKRRPMDDPEHLRRMIEGSNLLVTAREEDQLVGFLRGLSDFCYRCFIADLAVAEAYQGKGIGRKILQFTRDLAPDARLFLFSAEDAEPFYQKLGFQLHERCYQLKPGEDMN